MSISSRRDLILGGGMGLGAVALSAMSAQGPHHKARAKNCIFLLMEGGPSHIDTFDPKPRLDSLHMTKFQKERNKFEANMNTGERYYVKSPFQFRRAGKMRLFGSERIDEAIRDGGFGVQAIQPTEH